MLRVCQRDDARIDRKISMRCFDTIMNSFSLERERTWTAEMLEQYENVIGRDVIRDNRDACVELWLAAHNNLAAREGARRNAPDVVARKNAQSSLLNCQRATRAREAAAKNKIHTSETLICILHVVQQVLRVPIRSAQRDATSATPQTQSQSHQRHASATRASNTQTKSKVQTRT